MKKGSKLFIGIQTALLMTAVALPAQAAINIGAPPSLSGSVVTLHSYTPVSAQTNPASVSSTGWTSIPVSSTTQPQGTQTSVPTTTTVYTQNSAPVPSQSITIGQPVSGGNVISLKNIFSQPASTPVTVTSPTTVTVTSPTTASPSSTSAAASTTPALPAIPAVTALTGDEQQMVDMINQERIAAGVSPLKVDLRLASVAQAKANDLKANNYFDHTSPVYGSPWAMMQQVGLNVQWAGENISGNDSVAGSMAALMQSPGHRANILDPRFTAVGVGIAYGSAYGNLYVQEFLQE